MHKMTASTICAVVLCSVIAFVSVEIHGQSPAPPDFSGVYYPAPQGGGARRRCSSRRPAGRNHSSSAANAVSSDRRFVEWASA